MGNDAIYVFIQDQEYDHYNKRVFSAKADAVHLNVELAEKTKMLDGSNPLHLKEINAYREALDLEKMNLRDPEETLLEETRRASKEPKKNKIVHK